jgi:hypothetical protein
VNLLVNEASDFDSSMDPTYIPKEEHSNNVEEDEETNSISGKYTLLTL